jgi:hypothetical protein
MFLKTYTKQELEAMNFLKSENIRLPKQVYTEQFEAIYHELYGIYPELHYIYLYHKYGAGFANTFVNNNMVEVRKVFNERIAERKKKYERSENYNPFLKCGLP